MLNRKFLFVCLLVLLMPMLTILIPSAANADTAPVVTISPIQAAASTAGAHVNPSYCFGWDSLGLTSDDSIVVLFENSSNANTRFDIESLTASEVTFYVGTKTCTGGTARVTETGTDDNNAHDQFSLLTRAWAPALNGGNYVGFTIVLDENSGDVPFVINDTDDISIGITPSGDAVLTPFTAGNYGFMLAQAIGAIESFGLDIVTLDWQNKQLLYIGNSNIVNISSTVDPSISLALDVNDCALGNLSPTALKTCAFQATIATNAVGGYSSYIRQNHPFQSTNGSTTTVIAGPDTNGVIDGTDPLSGDYGEYGIGVQSSDNLGTAWNAFTGNCTDYNNGTTDLGAAAIQDTEATPDTDVELTYNSNPVDGTDNGLIKLCAGTRIKYNTPPGYYNQLLTITVVGNF